jgi:hypothetical protein
MNCETRPSDQGRANAVSPLDRPGVRAGLAELRSGGKCETCRDRAALVRGDGVLLCSLCGRIDRQRREFSMRRARRARG